MTPLRNRSWQTSLAGCAAILAAIASVVAAMFDGDPATVPDWTLAASAIAAGAGLLRARDGNKTSESVGAVTTSTPPPKEP